MTEDAHIAIRQSVRSMASDGHDTARFDHMLLLGAIVALLLTGLSYLANFSWLLELLTHFRLQFATGAILLVIASLLRRQVLPVILAALVVVFNSAALVPYVVPAAGTVQAGQVDVRLMVANVRFGNAQFSALREAIREEDPDIIGLMEVTVTWLQELDPIKTDYPHTVLRPEEGAYGLALYSRLPLSEKPGSPWVQGGLQTAIVADVEFEQTPVTVVLSHLRAPTSPEKARLRNEQLSQIAAMFQADQINEQILIGDLNTTPWSPYYQALETHAGLANAANGRGYVSTWPSWLPAGFLRIPIDHCLLSEGLRVQQVRTGPKIGSDHLPIVCDVAVGMPLVPESI